MANLHYTFSILGYSALAVLYFVERDFLGAFLLWLALLAIKTLFKPLREQSPLLFIVGLCFLLLKLLAMVSPWLQWPFDFYLATLFGFFILRYIIKKPAEPLKWSFSFSKMEIASLFIINIPSVAILIWYYLKNPEVANMWPVPPLPVWSIPLVVITIAAINGLREGIFYRGLLQPLSAKHSPFWYQIMLQAVLFGFMHFMNAFPQGWLGVFLTAVWGAAIAIQFRIFKSISLAWLTHSVADAVMFSIILFTRT